MIDRELGSLLLVLLFWRTLTDILGKPKCQGDKNILIDWSSLTHQVERNSVVLDLGLLSFCLAGNWACARPLQNSLKMYGAIHPKRLVNLCSQFPGSLFRVLQTPPC